jgi:uncharacterized C2H2 Zn-finger protein
MFEEGDEDNENENENDEYEEEEEEEHDADAEAEDIARRLKDELTAAIAKAQAEQAAAAAISHGPAQILALPAATGTLRQTSFKKELSAIATMKSVLSYASKDPLVSFTLASAPVVDANGLKSNVLQILQQSVEAGFIPKELATPLSHVVVSLAKSDTLFASLKNSNTPAALLNKGKRKRDKMDLSQASRGLAPSPWIEHENLLNKIKSAVQIIIQSLSSSSLNEPLSSSLSASASAPLNPALISSLQAPLHQVFLFAVTTAPSSSHNGALQEIGGLIQMLGVLSGIHIGPTQSSQHVSHNNGQPDLSTAVYPCLLPSCHKTFARLYSLRSHQRAHSAHPSIRPYRCLQCPASFARNHDLKRHLKLHGSKAFKCSGCGKVFSRRDAIKRHMNSSRMKTEALVANTTTAAATTGHGTGRREEAERCRDGEVIEVDVDKEEGEEGVKEERRAKIWGDRIASAAHFDVRQLPQDESPLEEGEIFAPAVVEAQNLVLGLFDVLSGYVAKYAPPNITSSDPAGRQQDRVEFSKTVASIMASQNWAQSEPPKDIMEPAVSDPSLPSLSLSWLSPEQTKQLEEAIAAAAKAAQEQAEAEAAWEEENDGDDEPSGGDPTT